MLYKFKSRATADLIMLEANGRQVLEIIGKSTEAHGIITAEQIPATIAALEAAVAEDSARRAAAGSGENEDGEGNADQADQPSSKDDVSLARRVTPFLDMLRRSAAEGKEVVW